MPNFDSDDEGILYRPRRQKGRARYQRLESLLRDWYGSEVASREIVARLPQTVHVGAPVDAVMAQTFSPDLFHLEQLKKTWAEYVGPILAKQCRPATIRKGILTIEADNSAVLMELRHYHNSVLLRKIREAFGAEFCARLNFAAAGADVVPSRVQSPKGPNGNTTR